ncbi:hypothetical protein K503DRAFT_33172 [Rhizopogon vinicolor AM-OR11-026]|uniref:Uncharacterized protein n=1 Tax=Rhizopogon vinicolor AM-OR11-026 TaxID=1314800 RepID=A0A1B7N581_9AGAM|nr:hypothetical protein K503DRAFT_33172 [Rhizopogon vinicolor AM-OR11-026]
MEWQKGLCRLYSRVWLHYNLLLFSPSVVRALIKLKVYTRPGLIIAKRSISDYRIAYALRHKHMIIRRPWTCSHHWSKQLKRSLYKGEFMSFVFVIDSGYSRPQDASWTYAERFTCGNPPTKIHSS